MAALLGDCDRPADTLMGFISIRLVGRLSGTLPATSSSGNSTIISCSSVRLVLPFQVLLPGSRFGSAAPTATGATGASSSAKEGKFGSCGGEAALN